MKVPQRESFEICIVLKIVSGLSFDWPEVQHKKTQIRYAELEIYCPYFYICVIKDACI